MNTVIVTGRFVYKPENRPTDKGISFVSTRIAVSRNDKNRTTDFFNLKAWNSTAKFICDYFDKGDPIEVRGRLETSSYTKQDGTKTTETYILADEVSFCLKVADKEQSTTVAQVAPTKPTNDMSQNILDSGIAELLDDTPGELPFDI